MNDPKFVEHDPVLRLVLHIDLRPIDLHVVATGHELPLRLAARALWVRRSSGQGACGRGHRALSCHRRAAAR